MRPFLRVCFLTLFLSAVIGAQAPSPAPASPDASKPTIASIQPPSGTGGARVKIVGTNFGSEKGTSTITFGGKTAQTSDWLDTSITAIVPPGSKTGKLEVVVNVAKNAATASTKATPDAAPVPNFTVDAPEYDQSAFEVLTGVGAVLAGAEATSYKTDNDALSATNVGRKTPEILLGGGFILPWRAGGGWIERSYCGAKAQQGATKDPPDNCGSGGAYRDYRPWEAFLSIRFAPANDQTINGFVVGGGYRITKYLSLMMGYSVTPVEEPSPGFRVAAAKIVTDNPTIAPYNRYNPAALLNDSPGAFDGFPLFVYNASGVTTAKLFPSSPTVTHHRSGIYFGVGIPLNLTSLFKPAAGK